MSVRPLLVVVGLAGVAAMYGFASVRPPPVCTIVTDGSQTVYWHERAHCLGWVHAPFTYAVPPAYYRGMALNAELVVIKCGRKHACKSVRKMCFQLWGEDQSDYANQPGYQNFNGCQVANY